MNRRFIFIVSVLLLGYGAGRAVAQGQAGATGKLGLPDKRKKDPDYKPVASAKVVKATARTSALVVVAEAGAQVFLEPISGKNSRKKLRCDVETDRRACNFIELNPGAYLVSVELAGYEDTEGKGGEKSVQLVPGRHTTIEFKLRPITHTITLKTNVKTGRVMYGLRGSNNKQLQELVNGLAILHNLPAGQFELELSASEVGYRPLKYTLDVGAGPKEIELKLERRMSEQPFSANWGSLDGWDAPTDWRVSFNKLTAKGKGVALPSSEALRNYFDFELVADVQMTNDNAASFIVRAQDKRNYYLIQITGSQSERPYVLRGFVVKDGIAKPLPTAPININAYDMQIGKGQFFELTIQCIGNKFTVFLGDSKEGSRLGGLEDSDNLFPSGAFGIAVHDREQQGVARFVITPIKR